MTLISRRALLTSGALTGMATLLAPPRAAWALDATSSAAELGARGELLRSDLLPHVESTFLAIRGGVRPARLRLQGVGEVSAAAAAGSVGAEDCFSAEFAGTRHAPLAQGTYTLWHPSLGRLELFLVPVGRVGRQARYEAVVNRRAVGAHRTV